MTRYSLLDLQTLPQLIPHLTDLQLKEAWGDAVKLHKDIELLCERFETEHLKRISVKEKKGE